MIDRKRMATYTGTIAPGGVLHAVEEERSYGTTWLRPMCGGAWRSVLNPGVEAFDYRYRGGRLCGSAACQRAFREDLTDGA